ncbi:hypothetical protein ACHAPO_002832 [Fusarium lateritium]
MFAPFSADKKAAEESTRKVKKEEDEKEGLDKTVEKKEPEQEKKKDKKRKSKDQGGRDAVKCYHCQRMGHKAHECPERENQRQADRTDGFNLAYMTVNPRLDALDLGLAAEQKKTKEAEKRAEKAEKKIKEVEKKLEEQGKKIAFFEYFLEKKFPVQPTTE